MHLLSCLYQSQLHFFSVSSHFFSCFFSFCCAGFANRALCCSGDLLDSASFRCSCHCLSSVSHTSQSNVDIMQSCLSKAFRNTKHPIVFRAGRGTQFDDGGHLVHDKRWVSSHSRFCTFFVGNAMSNKFSFSLVHPSRCSFSSPSSSNRETMFCHSTFRTRKTEMRVISFLRGLRLVESHLYRFRATKLVTVVFYWRTILGYL